MPLRRTVRWAGRREGTGSQSDSFLACLSDQIPAKPTGPPDRKSEEERRPPSSAVLPPLVEPVRHDDAAMASQGIPEHRWGGPGLTRNPPRSRAGPADHLGWMVWEDFVTTVLLNGEDGIGLGVRAFHPRWSDRHTRNSEAGDVRMLREQTRDVLRRHMARDKVAADDSDMAGLGVRRDAELVPTESVSTTFETATV